MINKASIDFDDTLDRLDVQEFARYLVGKGWDVYIVTCRPDKYIGKYIGQERPNNDYVYEVAKWCGIKEENIIFLGGGKDKIEYLSGERFIFHIDDSPDELMRIRESDDDCYPISVDYYDWKEHLKEKFKI